MINLYVFSANYAHEDSELSKIFTHYETPYTDEDFEKIVSGIVEKQPHEIKSDTVNLCKAVVKELTTVHGFVVIEPVGYYSHIIE